MKAQRIILVLLAAMAMVGSCVYPYDSPVPSSQYSGLVVEGDILVGGISEISLGRLLPLTEEAPDSLLAPVDATVRVESSLGNSFEGQKTENGNFQVDLRSAPYDGEYRLVVNTADGAIYSTPFTNPVGICEIDALNYMVDGTDVSILLDMHSDGAARHFRYSYHETWEYHSQIRAMIYYEPSSSLYPYGNIKSFPDGNDIYYCWKKAYSRGINLFTTETMDVDSLKDYPIAGFDSYDKKFSIHYRMDVDVYPVDSNSYRYYEHLKEVSTFTGSLFAPVPSELKGNVSCQTDPSRTAYGYVAVVRPSSKRIELSPEDVSYVTRDPIEVKLSYTSEQGTWPYMYNRGYLPVEYDPMVGIAWAEKRCVDCRYSGGTKTKPADWPTFHQ